MPGCFRGQGECAGSDPITGTRPWPHSSVCVISGQLLNFSEPQILHPKMGEIRTPISMGSCLRTSYMYVKSLPHSNCDLCSCFYLFLFLIQEWENSVRVWVGEKIQAFEHALLPVESVQLASKSAFCYKNL